MKSIHIFLISIKNTFSSKYKLWHISIMLLYIYLLLVFITYNYSFCHHYSYLGFNVNILLNIDTANKIQRISIIKTNPYILTKSFIQKFNSYIKKYNFQNNKVFFSQHYSNYLQSLGFIRSVHCINILIDKKKYITLSITVNPLIKRIKIYNHNKLIISSEKLKKLFQKQFGLPKNYNTISYILKQINSWYKIRGFEWITIHLIEDNNINDINIEIIEGKILTTKILCDHKKSYFKKNHKNLNKLIKKELSIITGEILNKITLEKTIQLIKKKYFIDNIKYVIKSEKNGITLILKYNLHKNYFTQSNYQLYNLNNTSIAFLPKYYIKSFQFIKNTSWLYQVFNISFNYNLFLRFIHLFSKNYILSHFTNISFMYKKYFALNVYIKYPYLKLYKYISLNLNFHFSYIRKYINTKSNYQSSYLKKYKYDKNNFYEKNYISNILYSEIKSKYNIHQNIVIKHLFKTLISQYYKIYIYSSNHNINIFYRSIQTVKSKLIFYNLITKFKIKISTYHIIQQTILKFHYQLLLDIKKQIFTKICTYQHYKHNLNIYFYYYIKIQPIKKYNQYLLIFIRYNIYNDFIQRIFFLQKLLSQSITYKHKIQTPYFLLNLQYNAYLHKYIKAYIFMHYNINLQQPKYYSKQFTNYNFINSYQALMKNKYTIYGYGTQIKLPIKQIPYIRLEYIINCKKNSFLLIEKLSI
uniref:Uncharacterized protein n=1 Tax=Antithamnion hubbsii TaxID=1005974 RepID=A0A4D6WS32_9FLOR|nr:hypothetical protein [Antithamnion hubbsii]